jgi:hypothetical protein
LQTKAGRLLGHAQSEGPSNHCFVSLAMVYVLSAQPIAPAGTWGAVGKLGPPRPPADVSVQSFWHVSDMRAQSSTRSLATSSAGSPKHNTPCAGRNGSARKPGCVRHQRAQRNSDLSQGPLCRCDLGRVHGRPTVGSHREPGTRQAASGPFRDMAVPWSPEG